MVLGASVAALPIPFKGRIVKNTLLDLLAVVVIAGALLVGLLAYFDVLTK